MWPPMWTRNTALGRYFDALASKSANDKHRSSRLQSTNWTSAPALIAASGVAMNVFDGHRTVWPVTFAKFSAASAPPVQLLNATAAASARSAQASSSREVISASDQR